MLSMNIGSHQQWLPSDMAKLVKSMKKLTLGRHSEAFPVHDCGTGLVILTLGDPHLLECAEGGEDGAADPHRVLSLRGGHHLDLHCGWCQSCKLLSHALANANKHCGATREHNIAVEIFSDIHITFHDRLEGCVMNSA